MHTALDCTSVSTFKACIKGLPFKARCPSSSAATWPGLPSRLFIYSFVPSINHQLVPWGSRKWSWGNVNFMLPPLARYGVERQKTTGRRAGGECGARKEEGAMGINQMTTHAFPSPHKGRKPLLPSLVLPAATVPPLAAMRYKTHSAWNRILVLRLGKIAFSSSVPSIYTCIFVI